MKHPTIIPGRGGLPPTSNVPWSSWQEKFARTLVIVDFSAMWMFIFVFLGLIAFRKPWWLCVIAGFPVIVFYRLLQQDRRKLYAMLLNKPRDIGRLTRWTEHPWNDWNVQCECGRSIDMRTAPYFKDTKRFSRVCECGRGHFIPSTQAASSVKP